MDTTNEKGASEETQQLMLDYREIIDEALTEQERNEPSRRSVIEINKVMDKAEQLFTKVKSPDEALLDAKVLSISSSVLKQNAESFDTNLTSYNSNTFAENIKRYLQVKHLPGQRPEIEWNKLVPIAKKCFKYRTPSLTCMYGTFQVGEVAAPLKTVQTKRDKLVEAKKKEPENVNSVEKEEEGIEETVQYILKVLISAWKKNNCKPINYYNLVINPQSFGATVENIFYVSFLVKDFLVDMNFDENDLPVIEPVSKSVAEKRKKENLVPVKNQFIMSINMKVWKQLIERYGITTPMINPENKEQ